MALYDVHALQNFLGSVCQVDLIAQNIPLCQAQIIIDRNELATFLAATATAQLGQISSMVTAFSVSLTASMPTTTTVDSTTTSRTDTASPTTNSTSATTSSSSTEIDNSETSSFSTSASTTQSFVEHFADPSDSFASLSTTDGGDSTASQNAQNNEVVGLSGTAVAVITVVSLVAGAVIFVGSLLFLRRLSRKRAAQDGQFQKMPEPQDDSRNKSQRPPTLQVNGSSFSFARANKSPTRFSINPFEAQRRRNSSNSEFVSAGDQDMSSR